MEAKWFEGKKGLVLGVANEFSIATEVAKLLSKQGAKIGYNHLPDKEGRNRMARRVERAVGDLDPAFIAPCDVNDDDQLDAFFGRVKEEFGTLDFLVHSIAYAPIDDLKGDTSACSRQGFREAMDTSVYSFLACTHRAREMMNEGGSIVGMTYYGGEKVVAGYNIMGVCKAALDAAIKYAAFDLGPQKVRVNGISAGPIKTLAASAVGEFSEMMRLNAAVSPLGENCTREDVANAAAYLLSEYSRATTGEIHHVDCGYNIMGSPGHAIERLGIPTSEG